MINLSEIFNNEGLEFFDGKKFSLDDYKAPDYQDEQEEIDSSVIFETPHNKQSFRRLKLINHDAGFLKYFLDGSRKVYIVGEFISGDSKYLPIVAGQIAIACCERKNKRMKKFRMSRCNGIVFPGDRINNDVLSSIKNKIREKIMESNFSKRVSSNVEWALQDYKLRGVFHNPNVKIEDKGTAKIQEIMQSYEVEMIHNIAEEGFLQEDSMLVVDGSLRFERQTKRMECRYFKNVISIAKTFDPHKTRLLKKKTKEIGAYLKDLKFGHRTPVFLIENKKKTLKFGTWYIRIRKQNYLKNPLDGIVKVEKLATTMDENDYGFDSGLIDNISSSILAERNPTSYGRDKRWASHLYPIYLTEKLVKSCFLSDTFFLNIFK